MNARRRPAATLILSLLFVAEAFFAGCVYRTREFASAKARETECLGWSITPSIWALKGSSSPDHAAKHDYTVSVTGGNSGSPLRMRIDSVRLSVGGREHAKKNAMTAFSDRTASLDVTGDSAIRIEPAYRDAELRIGLTFMPKVFDRNAMADTVLILKLKKIDKTFVSFPSY
jgi:hypothetical protein